MKDVNICQLCKQYIYIYTHIVYIYIYTHIVYIYIYTLCIYIYTYCIYIYIYIVYIYIYIHIVYIYIYIVYIYIYTYCIIFLHCVYIYTLYILYIYTLYIYTYYIDIDMEYFQYHIDHAYMDEMPTEWDAQVLYTPQRPFMVTQSLVDKSTTCLIKTSVRYSPDLHSSALPINVIGRAWGRRF